MAAKRTARQRVLHQSAQTREPFAHVGRSRSQPDARAHRLSARDDAHRRHSATRAHTKAASSAVVSIRTVAPEASTSCTMPLWPAAASERVAGWGLRTSGTTLTGTNVALAAGPATRALSFTGASSFPARQSAFHRCTLLGFTSLSRAIPTTDAPSTSVSSTIRRFSAGGK